MKIIAVDVHDYALHFRGRAYTLSKGRVVENQRALVVRIEADDGRVGWGETAPLGRTHLQAFAEGERAGLQLLSTAILGLDPRDIGALHAVMSRTLLAGMAAKAAIDIACWDIFGQASGVPVGLLLGGTRSLRFPVWDSIPLVAPDAVRLQAQVARDAGVRHFQIKVGGDPEDDVARVDALLEVAGPGAVVVADANGGWTAAQALRAAHLLADRPVHLEQPCATLRDCAQLRRHSALPLILDEPIINVVDLADAKAIGATGVNVKPSRVGGLAPARLMRDAACALGMTVTIDDSWGGAITTAALSHLAGGTPPELLLAVSFFTELTEPMLGTAPRRMPDGYGTAPVSPGLGLAVDEAMLGAPILSARL